MSLVPTQHQKKILIRKIKELSPKVALNIVKIILKNNQNQKYSKSSNRLLIKDDTIDDKTYHEISEFIANYKDNTNEESQREKELEAYKKNMRKNENVPKNTISKQTLKYNKENIKILLKALAKYSEIEFKPLPEKLEVKKSKYSSIETRIIKRINQSEKEKKKSLKFLSSGTIEKISDADMDDYIDNDDEADDEEIEEVEESEEVEDDEQEDISENEEDEDEDENLSEVEAEVEEVEENEDEIEENENGVEDEVDDFSEEIDNEEVDSSCESDSENEVEEVESDNSD